jgi:hypothetical protein
MKAAKTNKAAVMQINGNGEEEGMEPIIEIQEWCKKPQPSN